MEEKGQLFLIAEFKLIRLLKIESHYSAVLINSVRSRQWMLRLVGGCLMDSLVLKYLLKNAY